MSEKCIAIYALCEPDTCEVRYVGKTNNVQRRLSNHLCAREGSYLPSQKWIVDLGKMGREPLLFILEWSKEWEESERRWISNFRKDGARLLNVAPGGASSWSSNERRFGDHKKYRSAIMTLSQRSKELSNSARKSFRELMDQIKEARNGIMQDMGEDAVFDFDDCIYSDIVLRKPKSFRVLNNG